MTPLWHYCCSHSHLALQDDPWVRPVGQMHPHIAEQHPMPWVCGVTWFTDMGQPDRGALGLTSQILECDRTEHRYRSLDIDGRLRHFPRWARQHLTPHERALMVEFLPGNPMHWWVSTQPVPVVYSPTIR